MADTESIHGLKVHPAASHFPLLGVRETRKLAEDIEKNGLVNPPLFFDGMLLDGRNRANAWVEAGFKIKDMPRVEYELDDEIDAKDEKKVQAALYHTVWSLNYQRRHLSDRQKNAIAIKMHKDMGTFEELTADDLAEETKTKKSTSKKVLGEAKKNPTKIDKLAKGEKGKQGRPSGGGPPRRITLDKEEFTPTALAEMVIEKWADAPRSYLKNFIFQLDKKFGEWEAEQELLEEAPTANGGASAEA